MGYSYQWLFTDANRNHFTYQPVYEPLVALFNEAQQQLKGALIFTIITE